MLPPPFIDFVLSRGHADGVLISGCAEQDCFERLGDQFTEQRIANERDPNLRDRVPRDRVAVAWNNPAGWARCATRWRSSAHTWATAKSRRDQSVRPGGRTRGTGLRQRAMPASWRPMRPSQPSSATSPRNRRYASLGPNEALLKLSFIHAGQPLQACRHYTPEELAKTAVTRRQATDCARGRWPVTVELDLDGQPLYRGTHEPAGLWNDGPSSVYARFEVPAGRHRIDARLRDDGSKQGFDYSGSETVDFAPGQNFVVDFSAADGGFVFGHAVGGPDQGGRP